MNVSEKDLIGGVSESQLQEVSQRKEEVKERDEVAQLEAELSQMSCAQATIERVTSFVAACEPLLAQLKNKQGNKGLDYQRYSTKVAEMALRALIIIINKSQEIALSWELKSSSEKEKEWENIQKTVAEAWSLMLRLESLGLEASFRKGIFKHNKAELRKICKTCRVVTSRSSGCGSPILWGIISALLWQVIQRLLL